MNYGRLQILYVVAACCVRLRESPNYAICRIPQGCRVWLTPIHEFARLKGLSGAETKGRRQVRENDIAREQGAVFEPAGAAAGCEFRLYSNKSGDSCERHRGSRSSLSSSKELNAAGCTGPGSGSVCFSAASRARWFASERLRLGVGGRAFGTVLYRCPLEHPSRGVEQARFM
jgi:hypothetical protein